MRDALQTLEKAGVKPIGISPDDPDTLQRFSQRHQVPFPLLSDMDHHVAQAFGAWGEKKVRGKKIIGVIRSACLADEKGRIIKAWPKISPKKTVPELLAALGFSGD